MKNEVIELGFLDNGTGKHQSNTIYSIGGGNADAVRCTIENPAENRYRLCPKTAYCIDANYSKGLSVKWYLQYGARRQLVIEEW